MKTVRDGNMNRENSNWNWNVRHPRYSALHDANVTIRIEVEGENEAGGRQFEVQLLDLSLSGFQVRSDVDLPTEASILVHVETNDGYALSRAATVQWCRPDAGSEIWKLGCCFQTPLELQDLGELFLCEAIDPS